MKKAVCCQHPLIQVDIFQVGIWRRMDAHTIYKAHMRLHIPFIYNYAVISIAHKPMPENANLRLTPFLGSHEPTGRSKAREVLLQNRQSVLSEGRLKARFVSPNPQTGKVGAKINPSTNLTQPQSRGNCFCSFLFFFRPLKMGP